MRSYPIKQIALDQATRRLEEAKEAISMLAGTTDFNEMEVAWSRFLILSNGVYAKVEQVSKLNAKSKAWYSRKKTIENQIHCCYTHVKHETQTSIASNLSPLGTLIP